MERLHKLADIAAVLALVATGSACSDTTGTEDWWDEEARAEFLNGYEKSSPDSPAEPEQVVRPGTKDPREKRKY